MTVVPLQAWGRVRSGPADPPAAGEMAGAAASPGRSVAGRERRILNGTRLLRVQTETRGSRAVTGAERRQGPGADTWAAAENTWTRFPQREQRLTPSGIPAAVSRETRKSRKTSIFPGQRHKWSFFYDSKQELHPM